MDITEIKDILRGGNSSSDNENNDIFQIDEKKTILDYKEYIYEVAHLPQPTPSDIDKPMKTTLLWDLITDDNVPFAVIAGVLGIFVFMSVIFTFWLFWRRKERYEHLAFRDDRLPDHFHKATEDGLEEDCENTFTGVSVPLIQDSSKV